MEDAPEVLRFYRDWIADCPDELMTIAVQRRAPALPIVPPDLVGKLVMAVVACYAGPVEDGERVVRPLKEFGSPVLDLCGPKPYPGPSADVRSVVPARLVVLRPIL